MNNRQYWLHRIDNIYDKNYNTKKIKEVYKQALTSIQNDILELQQLAQSKELSRTQIYKLKKYKALEEKISGIINEVKPVVKSEIKTALQTGAKEASMAAVEISGKQFNVLNDNQINAVLNTKWSGASYKTRVADNMNNFARRLKSDVLTAVTTGKNKDELIKSVKNTVNAEYYKLDRIYRTELQHALNMSQARTYAESGVKKVEWLAELDGRCCDTCRELNGATFDINKIPSLVAHPNCRCTILPVLKDYKVLGSGDTTQSTPHKPPELLDTVENITYNKAVSILKKHEAEIVKSTVENAIVVTQGGEVWKCYGCETAVFIDEDLGDKLKNAYVTHNHPDDETSYSFSKNDMNLFYDYNLNTLRGVDYKYTYIFDRSGAIDFTDYAHTISDVDKFNYDHTLSIEYAKLNKIGYRRIKNG